MLGCVHRCVFHFEHISVCSDAVVREKDRDRKRICVRV